MPTSVRMVPYQSEEAKQALGESYQPGRPNAAFLVHPIMGKLPVGSMPFWPSSHVLKVDESSQFS